MHYLFEAHECSILLAEEEKEVSHAYTTTNTHFTKYVEELHNEWKSCENPDKFDWSKQSTAQKIVLGMKSVGNRVCPWVDVGIIYVPFHSKDHWILWVISLPAKSITVYDSLSYRKGTRDSIAGLAEFLPIMLGSIGAFGSLKIEDQTSEPFKIIFADDMPQQHNG